MRTHLIDWWHGRSCSTSSFVPSSPLVRVSFGTSPIFRPDILYKQPRYRRQCKARHMYVTHADVQKRFTSSSLHILHSTALSYRQMINSTCLYGVGGATFQCDDTTYKIFCTEKCWMCVFNNQPSFHDEKLLLLTLVYLTIFIMFYLDRKVPI